jgi:hypothetical protein
MTTENVCIDKWLTVVLQAHENNSVLEMHTRWEFKLIFIPSA